MPIYKIVNRVTGDCYVGKTQNSVETRFLHHRYEHGSSQTHIHRAMRKYGLASFSIEVLEDCLFEELDLREKHWISLLAPRYNMTMGGEGGPTHHLPSWKEGMENRRSMAGANNPMFGKGGMIGKTHKEETRGKMAASHQARWNKMDDDARRALSLKTSGNKNPMFGKTPVNATAVKYNGVDYASLAAASRATGISISTIKKRGMIYD